MARKNTNDYIARYSGANNPILRYNNAIQSGEIIVSQKVKATYERLSAELAETSGRWVYDDASAARVITFVEAFCKHSKGKWGGQPIKLELWQEALLAAAFGFLDAQTGYRRFTEVLLIVGRKNGKSTLAAAVGLYLMIADGEPGAEVYCTATKKDQAKIIWLEAKRMVNKSPALRRRIKPLVAEMVGVDGFDGCLFKPLGADSETQDGLNVHGSTMDEIHAWPGMDLYNVVVDGMSARDQPMNFITTTAGFQQNGLYDEKYEEATKVLTGIVQNDRLLPVVYELDSPDEVYDPTCWAKANPGLGTIKSIQALEDKVNKARQNSRMLPNLLTKDFDVKANTDEAWLTFDEVNNTDTFDPEDLRGCYAVGGCDLSATTDLSCASLLIVKPGSDELFVMQQYFIPERKLEITEGDGKTHEAPYRVWEERGLLTVTPGNTVDYHAVTKWFVDVFTNYEIRPLWVCYDRAFAGYWAEEMSEYFDMERIPQGAFTWSQPMKEMGAALSAHRVNYNNNPMLKWCLSNTRVKSKNADGIETIEPKKINEKRRIDGMVSLLNAWVGYVRHHDDLVAYANYSNKKG